MAQTNLVTRLRAEVAGAFPAPAAQPTATARTVIIAVSGGADSLCLADAVVAVAPEQNLAPIIAHLNHQLRGEAADADADFVRRFAEACLVPCHIAVVDVAEVAAQTHTSIEVAARQARYAFLAKVAADAGASLVTTAHHADDQAETVLMRLLRGTGIAGLRGMQPCAPWPDSTVQTNLKLLRPLLRTTRAEIERYCQDRNLQPRHDASNDDSTYTRNRIRHELLPYLEQYNPGIRAVLARLADSATHDLEIIDYATQQAWAALAQPTQPHEPRSAENAIRLNRQIWQTLPQGLQRATLRFAVQQLKGEAIDLKYSAVEEARDVLNSSAATGEIALLADVRVDVGAKVFCVRRAG
jgi:tRNA(Ile)-lysidine synthase